MNVKTYNKSLAEQARKALNFAFMSEHNDEQTYFCNDTDSVTYQIHAKLGIVLLHLYATDVKIVWDYCSDYLRNKYYKNVKMGLKNDGKRAFVEAVIDNESLTALKKSFVSKGETGITTGKKEFDELFDYLSKKLASIKRHLFASPFEMMLEAAASNNAGKEIKRMPNLVYNVKPDASERIWLSFEKNQFTVYYGISFDDRSEQQLCKIFLSELVDARKHVHNPPNVSLSEAEIPQFLIEAFPDEKARKYRFTNGITCVTIFGSMVKKPETMATYLASFRNYIYYHVQAQKCYLHSRQLRKINSIQTDLQHTKIQPLATK